MSYPNTNPSANTRSTDPSRDTGAQNESWNDINFSNRATPGSDTDYSQQRFPAGQQGGYAGNTSDTNTFGAGGDFGSTRATTGQHSTQRGQNEFAGNTADANTFGAGGGFGHAGSQAGQQRNFRNEGPGGESWEQEGAGGQGRKPTMGERVKGSVEQMKGSVTRNRDLQERGKERKQGELDSNF